MSHATPFLRDQLTSRNRKRYEEMKEKLKQTLRQQDCCAVTHDTWTSIAKQSYCTITVHFVTPNWCLRSLSVETTSMNESHTSEAIARHLSSAQQVRGFQTPIAVSDNTAAETKAF